MIKTYFKNLLIEGHSVGLVKLHKEKNNPKIKDTHNVF